jgi:ubiquinone biosynthesis monooxygenase Coq7
MHNQRYYTRTDHLIMGISRALDTLFIKPAPNRDYPAKSADPEALSDQEKLESSRYMRVNHVGEICAQALYQSQALTAQDKSISEQMKQAAQEETDHLSWCEQRIDELGGRKSLLNPLWYAGSFAFGTLAGITGDKWNLGFVAETERQVVNHLEDHLGKLPENDLRSKEIVARMQKDESLHAEQAVAAGAAELPPPARLLMKCASKIMTKTAYWI